MSCRVAVNHVTSRCHTPDRVQRSKMSPSVTSPSLPQLPTMAAPGAGARRLEAATKTSTVRLRGQLSRTMLSRIDLPGVASSAALQLASCYTLWPSTHSSCYTRTPSTRMAICSPLWMNQAWMQRSSCLRRRDRLGAPRRFHLCQLYR